MSILDVISGKRRGLGAALLRCGLTVLEPMYATAIAARNFAYDRRLPLTPIHRASLPVISVGNITTGGTGKTPTTAWIAKQLQSQGHRPVLISRGYRSLDGVENDEKLLLDELCPGVPHLQNPDRVQSARLATEQQLGDVLILDDGFQHRRLHRDLDIVLIDAVNPWGYGHLLPRGLLREPLRSLRRADMVLLTRTELVGDGDLQAIRDQITRRTPAPVVATRFVPTQLVSSHGETRELEMLREHPIAAFCGIGNPQAFRQALMRTTGHERLGFREFPDHHHFTPQDITDLADWATQQGARHVITTRKDLVKIRQPKIGNCHLWALDIDLECVDGASELLKALQRFRH